MKAKVRVAIIDDGINPLGLRKKQIAGGINIGVAENKVIHYGDGLTKNTGSHGTACASIIEHVAPEAEIFSILVCDLNKGCPLNSLVAAINWAIENGAHIINISLAADKVADTQALEEVCAKAYKQNVLVIASRLNDRKAQVSYPADLEHVVSVKQKKIDLIGFYWFPVKILLSIFFEQNRITKRININRQYKSNSFMTAFVSGIIADLYCRNAVEKNGFFPVLEERIKMLKISDPLFRKLPETWVKIKKLYTVYL